MAIFYSVGIVFAVPAALILLRDLWGALRRLFTGAPAERVEAHFRELLGLHSEI